MGYNSKVKIENNYELFTIFWSFHFSYVLLHHSNGKCCCCSSVVEHFLGKEEVTSSILVNSSQSKDYVTRNPFFISAERPEGRQGTGGADGSGPPAAEMPNAKDAGREGALAAETPNAEMHAGVGRLPRCQMRRRTLGSAGRRDAASHAEVSGRGGHFRQTKSDKTNNPKPDCHPISQYCAQNGLSKPIVCRNFAV